jgi:hypothetical protein
VRKPVGSFGHVPGGSGAVTVIVACPETPSLVAVTTSCPTATPVTSPVLETVATCAFALVHVTTRPVSALPAASRVTALSWTVCPTCTLAVAGVTVTDATGAGAGALTVSVAAPVTPSLVARMLAVPAASAVT